MKKIEAIIKEIAAKHGIAVGRLMLHACHLRAPDHTPQLSLTVLEGEVGAPGTRLIKVGDLPLNPHILKQRVSVEEGADIAGNLGDGQYLHAAIIAQAETGQQKTKRAGPGGKNKPVRHGEQATWPLR